MAKFKAGNKASEGISKPTAGRPPDWLKEKCQSLVEKHELIEFLVSVAAGVDFEQGVGEEGETIKIPAALRDRIKAVELLLNRGWGRPDGENASTPRTPEDSVRNAENALNVLKSLETYGQVHG